MIKRFLALVLCLCMTLTLLPTTAFAALSDLLGNTPKKNQAILEQLSALTGGSSDQVLSMLNALGLLDEDGNFKVDQTITLDGQVLTLAAVMELLENPATDITRIADVDGTPVALGDLKTMIQIEQELQRIKDTYFSGREFTGEALENLNSLMEQLELRGISLQYSASATAPEGVETVDMSGMMSLTLGTEAYNNKCSSGTFTVYGGKPVGFSYRIQKGQLSKYIDDVEVSIGGVSGELQDDGSYKLTYKVDGPNSSLGGCQITVKVTTKGGAMAWHEGSFSYGDLLGMIEFYDAENLVFYDGVGYADHCQLKLKKTVPVPTIKRSMTAPSYVEEVKNTTVLYDDLFIPLLTESYTGGSANNSDFVALSNTIGILEGARNLVLPDGSAPFYQPYQIDADIKFDWTTSVEAYNGSAPYGYYNSTNPRPYAPFCLTEYKLGETSLNLSDDRKKALDCTINKGSTVSISLQSTTENRENQKYWLPFELYLKNVNNDIPNSTTTAKTSNVTAKLLDKDAPTIQSVTATAGTYASGQHVPITVTFNEFVNLRSASVTINGKDYSAAELSMNDYGVTAMLWYPVQDADANTVIVSSMTGVEDVFGNELDNSQYQGDSIAGVTLKSVLMRNAPTALTADYANGKASFTMNANMEQAYKTVYSKYHTPAGSEPKEAPFRLELKYDSAEAPSYLQVYLGEESGDFTISDYEIKPAASTRTYTVTLQANEGERDESNSNWVNVLPLTRQFTVPERVSVSTVTIVPEADPANYTISLAEAARPTLRAEVLGKSGKTASYTTGKWSSSDTDIATIDENTGLVATTGTKVGAVTFTFTADNGTVDTADDVQGTSQPYTVTAGDSLALVIPGSASIVTRVNQPATVLWSSNAALMASGKDFNYKIELYEGNYADEAALSGLQPVATYTAGKDKNSVRIPENVLSALSSGNAPAYTVRVSMPHPNAEGEDIRLSALAYIIVQAPPATAKLTPPQSIYLKDTDGPVNIDWSVKNATDAASPQPTLTITRVTEDNKTTKVVDSVRLSGTSGSFPLSLQSVQAGNLKDTYQVVLSVENSGESPSTDSFPLYVYDADALKVQDDKGHTISKLTMDNTSKVSGSLPTETDKILQLRQELGLIEYIGINYNEYGWNSFKDGIEWASNNNAISVNYKQGGLYEDIRNFSFKSYLPETKMALSGRANGTATVTAIHAATGMSAAVQVTAETLQNKFYLFQLTPAAKTTLQYTDGKGAPKTVRTNRDGVLALYEPNGIASEVSLRSGSGADIYLGTIYKENLRSGERDATKLQLYPLNTFSLRQVARASVTLITPGGDPLANETVTVRGGVYKNGGYCETALLGSKADALVSGTTGGTYTTDAAGNITVYLDSTQFWSAEKGESSTTPLSALDQLEYILEISEIDNDNYYPLLLTVNGKLGVDDVMRTAEGVVSLESVPPGEKNKPFIVAQSVDYGLANGQKVDVRSSTGKIGPNSSFKTATLHTTMFLWGEDIAKAQNYSLKLADEYGVLPAAQSSSTKQYPFSSIPVAENDLTLTEATMTTSGWIADGKDVGMKTQLSLNGSLLQEKIMPFRVVDLTRVPKVTEDERVTGILATMSSSSGVNQVDFGGVGDSNILKVLTGRLDDLSGPVNSSVFKMIITPSEDPSVFRAMIWAGYNTLEMEDMDYSKDGVALGANVLTQNLEVGVPGTGDLSQMAQGTYDPKGEYKANSLADNVTSTDLNLQLEGFYEAEIRYNAEKKEWEVFTVGGGFTAGVGVGFTFSVNAMAGPVPLTATFELGGAIQLDFRTAVRYGQQGQGTELAWSDPTATAVNDFLTTLRINAYVHAFGGIGFDYSVVALKIGLFGNLDVDSQNKFLSRTYLADKSKRQINGQALGIQSEVGIKFVATFLFISYEAVIASGTLGATRTFNNWKTIDDYWNSATSGLSLASLQMAAAQSGMQVASASATLQSRDYLEQYARTWGQPQQRMMLFSLNSPSGLESIQTNANPTSYPQLSDDGKILAYINDGNSSNIYDSRAHFSTLNDGVYTPSSQIDNLTEFPGYGDTSVSLSGTESFAAAAWVRMGTELPGKNAGNAVTLEEQNLLMNSTEIVVSVYNGTNWTSTRLTKDGTPDLAPATAVGGDDKAIVFWRSVYTPDPVSASGSNNLLNFTTRDCIMYSCYDSSNGRWSDAKMLYNGATGSVKALQAAMLPDGTAMAVYSLDRSGTGDTSAYEIAYCTVAADGTPGTAMLATCDSNLDENPQVVAANFGIGDDRFVIGWHSVRDGSSDIQLLAVDGSGTMSNSFPGSLSALTSSGNAVVGGDFRFASLSGDHRSINDLTIVWNETVNDDKGAVDHGILKAAKLRYAENTYTLSAPLELAELPKRTLADHFDAYVSGPNQVQAAIQANFYDDENPQVIGNVTVPGEKTILYTATSDFITDAVAVEQIGVDYATLALNSLTPIRFTIRNTGLNDVTSLTVSLGGGETATLTEKLLPNESTTLTVWHHVKDRVTDPSYTITADAGINETGTVYLDYPDIGISQMEVIAESAGKRTVRMTLYNSSAATLADGKNRKVKIAFYADDLHTKHAEVACATNGVSVRDNEITISENSALARIDQGTFTLDLTYDLGKYMNSIGKTEISNVGTYLYAEAWAEGQIGGTGSNQRLPEYDGSDSEASVHMTGALARTGEKLTMDVTQGNDGNGRSTAAITLRNNCLQSQNSAELVATLLDAAGTVLETKKTGIGGAISGETFRAETVTFSRLGTRVVVRAAVPGNDLLTFEGLAVGLGDFTANGTNYTYTLQNDSGATSTLVTAVSGNGEPVSINGQALSTGGSATVAIPNSGTTDIVVGIGAKTYTLTILRNSGTGGNQGGGGSGYSYYTIKATAGTDGSISPSGDVSVRKGRDQTFAITPDKGYAVANVKIDGKSIGAVKSYTFENVRRTHTIEVIFMKANGTPQTGVFVDVATGSYYEDAVDWAVENGITKGTDDTHFSPDGICTRAQAVTFLWRTAGSPKPETRAMPFTDVPVGSYYYDAVLWAVENGITKGTSDTTFSPNMTCSRAQIVAFLWRSEKSPAAGTANPFADVKSDAYYADAVLWAVKENITKGTTSTTFSPNAGCTRAQIVTFLYRAYQGK
ncbi:S-layer homology domain-containing protein [Colidextribacter sp. 210702-DFI.3.9]|nr:S-layer homology domain-containing protein [Colidextribacter sp. 210702-DFI.3.9]